MNNPQDSRLRHGDEPLCNHSPNPTFSSILETRLQRRQVLQGELPRQ